MKLLTPVVEIDKREELLSGKVVYVTNISFPTRFHLQNWPDRFIIDISVLGFGFTKVWKYE